MKERTNRKIASWFFLVQESNLQHGIDRALRYRKDYCGREWNWNGELDW